MLLSQVWPPFPTGDWEDRLGIWGKGEELEVSLKSPSWNHVFQSNFYHSVVDKVMLNKNCVLFSIGLFFLQVDSPSREWGVESGEAINMSDSSTKTPSARPNRFLTYNTRDLTGK